MHPYATNSGRAKPTPYKDRNLIGARYGALTILAFAERVDRELTATVRCDCGNTAKKKIPDVLSGKTRSCGCRIGSSRGLKYEVRGLIGKKFGLLTILAFAGRNKHHALLATVECDCGTQKEMIVQHLLTGRSKSCGCNRWKVYAARRVSGAYEDRNLIGTRYGMLTIVATVGHNAKGRFVVRVKCDCGEIKELPIGRLGRDVSCGCYRRNRKIHGMSKTKEYRTWIHMKERCGQVKDKSYANYGGRGIKVCERWQEFGNFYADLGLRPEGRSIDRRDGNGNYEPGNCRWATRLQQALNQRKRQNCSSRFRGVYSDKRSGGWQAAVQSNRRKIYLGRFKSEVEAARAYDAMALKLFGADAYPNFKYDDAPQDHGDLKKAVRSAEVQIDGVRSA